MASTPMFKIPISKPFLKSSLHKAIMPFTTTAPSENLLQSATAAACAMMTRGSRRSQSSVPMNGRRLLFAPVAFWTLALACVTLMAVVDAAPAKHTLAPNSLVNSMALTISETSALPLQLQIEAQVAGTQKLAYLPTTGPAMDFYYLNYRPSYLAGESKIDFWMLTPKGSTPPKSASLELFDEFGKIRLAVLAPEGTDIPANVASKNEPFLWKSWAIPKTLKADFDFSEKFRVVLKTSDAVASASTAAVKANRKNNKRIDSFLDDSAMVDFLLVKNKSKNTAAAVAAKPVTVQDRQFRIRGLQAAPGGQPNPAKVHVNRVAPIATSTPQDNSAKKVDAAPATAPASVEEKANTSVDREGTESSIGGSLSNKYNINSTPSSAMGLYPTSRSQWLIAFSTLLLGALAMSC